MRVRFTQGAKNCLRNIYEYYRDKGSGRYGHTMRRKIIRKSLKLKDFPLLGCVENNLEELGIGRRFLIEGADIFITDIFDTRQDPEKMLPH